MRVFAYQAKDSQIGKIIKSTLQAETEMQAGKILLDQNLIPIEIREAEEGSGLRTLGNKVKLKDKVVFSRQLATLISAGLPISQALHTVYEQTSHKRLKNIVGEIISKVESGKSLTESFGSFPDVFDNLFVALLSAGETSGTLDNALQKIADQQEKNSDLISKVKGAMTYPAIVLAVVAGVMAFLLLAVMPQVRDLYRDMRLELPILTKILIAFAGFISSWWWILIIAVLGAVFYLKRYIKTESGIKFKDNFKLNMPLFKGLLRKLYMARFLRTGQTLLSTGVPILDALGICAQAVNNFWVGEAIERAAESVKGGKSLSGSLKNEEYVLPLAPQMIKIGEQSGKIDEMMGRAADVYEKEIDAEIANLSKVIEPALMVMLAVVAGVMVAAILLPVYSMVGNIKM